MDDNKTPDVDEKETSPSSVNDAVLVEPDEDTPRQETDAVGAQSADDEHGQENSEQEDEPTEAAEQEETPSVEAVEEPAQSDGGDAEAPSSEGEDGGQAAPQGESEPQPKQRKKMSPRQKKRVAIACVAAVLVVAIVLGIALPIYFINKDKIFVSSAEDFLNYDDGTYFVLEDDLTVDGDVTIGRGYALDLNGHALIVNGTLTFDNPGTGEAAVGTLKKGAWTGAGSIDADNVVIVAPSGSFRLCAPLTVGGLTTSEGTRAGKLFFDGTIVCNGTMSVSAAEATFGANVSFGEGDAAQAIFTDVDSLTINASMTSAVEDKPAKVTFDDVTATINAAGAVDDLTLKGGSKVISFGAIGTARSEGGETPDTLVLAQNFTCGAVVDVAELAIELREGNSVNVTYTDGVGAPTYIRRLETPLDINVNPDTDKLVAAVAEVGGAVGYQFSVDGGEWLSAENGSHEYDITELLRSNTGTHTISARAAGNFSYDDPFALDPDGDGTRDEFLYLTSESISCEYVYQIELSTPTGLTVSTESGEDGATNYVLSFANVSFADYYIVHVNGVDIGRQDATDGEFMYVTLSGLKVGSNSIRVTAHSDNPDILPSDEAMTSLTVQGKLALSAESITAVYDSASELTTVTISAPEGASVFKLEYTLLDSQGEAQKMTLYTSSTSVNIRGLFSGTTITVTAIAGGAYADSDAITVNVFGA